ncbi:MAG: DEAD/DEAH box helicase [Anaerolineae bacterium]|nr:DEAD/DEAH box helicase [Anaerolineae bacterium]
MSARLFFCKEHKLIHTFQTLGLCPELIQAVTELGYEAPTPIQAQTIPLLLDGRDVLGQAQTGTGKTAAFALPMLHTLDANRDYVQGLVVAPTRELANQTATAIHTFGRHCGVRVLPIYGGQSYARQINRLKRGVDIVVGTPGRMLDLIRKHALELDAIRFLVLDEADEMLSMGFIEDIEAILQETPATRQTALFSATLDASIRRLADRYMRAPQAITINPEQLTVDSTEQRYYMVHDADKPAALARLLEMEDITSALVFTRTKSGADELVNTLSTQGFKAEALHGDMSQQSRETVLRHFRAGLCTLMVATDVAARGLDIEDVSHVINYDLPLDPEYYVHRIGRTGRAGKTGIAITLATPNERWRLNKIERYTSSSIAPAKLPTVSQIMNHRDEQFLDQLADQLALDQFQRERTLIAKLVETGCDPLDLAAAAIQLARREEQQRPIREVSQVHSPEPYNARRDHRAQPRPGRSHTGTGRREPGMVQLYLNVGKTHQVHPGQIVGAIAGQANIPGQAIGAISIQMSRTFVDVAEPYVEQVLQKMIGWKWRGKTIVLERAA